MRIPRVLIAGTHSGAGKTSVSAALMAAYTALGYDLRPFKAGPDYIDPAFHSFITGRPSHNLDAWLLPEDAVHTIFRQATVKDALSMQTAPLFDNASACRQTQKHGGPLLAIIEGVMGLFDGQGDGPEGSSAQIAQMLQAPVILVLDAKGISRSAAALVQGYNNFMPGLRLAGVICNRVSGAKHYELLRDIVEGQAGVTCFGYLPANPAFSLKSRHLGLVPAEEVADLRERVDNLGRAAREHIDLERLFALAETAKALPCSGRIRKIPANLPPERASGTISTAHNTKNTPAPIRIGLARDSAFSFYYQANLDLLETLGVQLVPFSPLGDAALLKGLHGLYLGGGFPEQFAAELAANTGMRASIREALDNGLPCYAECGGLLYLTQYLQIPAASAPQETETNPEKMTANRNGASYPMAGFFPCRAVMETRLQHFGYVSVTLEKDCPLGRAGTSFRAHEFHYSRLDWENEKRSEALHPVYNARKADGRSWSGGILKNNTLGVYPHLHFYACPDAAAYFVALCRAHAAAAASGGNGASS